MKSRFRSHATTYVALLVLLICGSAVVVVGCGGGAGVLAGLAALFGQQSLVAGVGVGAVFLGDEVQKPAALLPFTSEAKAIAVTGKGDKIIVSDTLHNTVAIINNQTRRVTSVLDVGTNPIFVGVTPDDQKAYVTNFGQDPNTSVDPIFGNTVSVIDLANEMVSTTITVGKGPSAVVFTPDSRNAYVVNAVFDPNNPTNEPATISVIDVQNDAVTKTIPLSLDGINGQSPAAVSITKDGTTVFVVNRLNAGGTSGYVAVIDTISNTVIQMIAVGNNPSGIALDPEDTTAFVTNQNDNTVSVIDISGEPAVVIAELPVGEGPGPVVFSPDGQRVYVANLLGTAGIVACSTPEDPIDGDGVGQTVSVIDAQTFTTLPGEIGVGIGPLGMVITEDSAKVYVISACEGIVSNFSANQIINDAAFNASQIAVPARATAVTLSSAKAEVYVAHPHAVSIIDTRTDSLTGDPVPVRGSGPIELVASAAASGNSFKLFAIHPGLRSISVVEDNGSSQTLVDSISLAGRPSSIIYSSDQSKLIVTLSGFSKTTSLSETLDKRIVLVDVNPVGQEDTLIANPLDVGEGPFKAVLDNNNRAYIAAFGHFFPNSREPFGEVSVLDIANNTLTAGNPLQNTAAKIILDLFYKESNNRLYVADTSGIQSFDPTAATDAGFIAGTGIGETDLPVDLASTTNMIYAIDYNVTNNIASLRGFDLLLDPDTPIDLPGPNPSKLRIGLVNGTVAAFILHAGDRSFICNQIEKKTCEIGNTMSVVDLQTGNFEQIDVGDRPTDIAFASVNGTDLVLVPSYFEGTVTVIDQASIDFDQSTVVVSKPPLFVGSGPSDILVREDTAYVANSIANDIAVIQLSDNLSIIRVENIIDLD